MKKRIHLFLTAVCVLALAAPAAAFETEFHGGMWHVFGGTDNEATLPHSQKSGSTDFFSYNGMLNDKGMSSSMYNVLGENDSTIFGLTKARLRFEGKTDDGLAKMVYGLEVGTYDWGDTKNKFGLSGDGVTQETRFAYAEVAVPGIGGKLRAGLQPTKINDWVWSETAAGLTYHYQLDSLKTMAGWYRGDNDNSTGTGDDDYVVLKMDNKFSDTYTMGLFGVYANLKDNETAAKDIYDSNVYWMGVNGKCGRDAVFASFDAIYQGGEMDFENPALDDIDRSAWLADVTVGVNVNDKFTLSGNVLYVSGDDDASDTDAANFDSIDVDAQVGIIFFKDTILADCDRTISDAPYIMDKGLINYAIQGEYQINEKNDLRMAVRYLTTAEDLTLKPGARDSDLGYEFDLWYTYKLNKYVELKCDAAYLVAGDAADHLAAADNYEGDDLYKVGAGMALKF